MLARITSTRVNDDDRLRLPPIPPPQSSGTEKKESQDRHHNQACRPSGKRSSTSSHDLHPDNVLTVTCSLQISPSLKCQSSARARTHDPHFPRLLVDNLFLHKKPRPMPGLLNRWGSFELSTSRPPGRRRRTCRRHPHAQLQWSDGRRGQQRV